MDRRIQLIFSAYGLVMLGLVIWRASTGAWSALHWAMLGVAAVCCLLVFVRFVFVFNFSYALSALINGAADRGVAGARPLPGWLAASRALYGLRLLCLHLVRDSNSDELRARAWPQSTRRTTAMPAPAKISLLGDVQPAADDFPGDGNRRSQAAQTAFAGAMDLRRRRGVLARCRRAMLAGTLIEGLADWQKQAGQESSTPDGW
jgi:hypothetical protein